MNNKGYLSQEGIDQVVRLYAGIEPVPERITRNVMAYGLYTLHLACALSVSAEELDAWVAPANRPEELREMTREEIVPLDARSAAEMLVETFEQEISLLEAERQRVWDEEDGPSLQRTLEGTSILTEEAARRVNRSHAESRSTFNRYWTALNKTLKTDAEEASDEDPAATSAPVAQGAADRVPNNPSFESDVTAQVAVEAKASDDAPVPTLVRRAGPPEGAELAAERVEQGGSNEPAKGAGLAPARRAADRVPNDPSFEPDVTAQVAEVTGSSVEARATAQGRREGSPSAVAGGPRRPNWPVQASGGMMAMPPGDVLPGWPHEVSGARGAPSA